MRTVRVALCQIESHPAIYNGHVAYLEEPFVPKPNGPSLSRLSRKGIDVQSLQDYCGTTYCGWIEARLKAIIAFLNEFKPSPDIVLFPEGAIPVPALPVLSAWSASSGSSILAGTHTPLNTVAALGIYATVGISPKERKRAVRASTGSVLPLFRNGKVILVPKKLASPFERTDVSVTGMESPTCDVYPVQTGGGQLTLLPLVCIEALRLPAVRRPYDLTAVVSYDARPEQFQAFIDQQVRNRIPVLYCNDGSCGSSRIGVVHDDRAPSWWRDTLPAGLPPGDSILIADIDIDATTIEVATAAPNAPWRLIALASIVGEHASSAEVSAALAGVFSLPEGAARAERLSQLLGTSGANVLQKVRLSYLSELERRGQPCAEWWSAFGRDCVVDGQDDLRGLEARLAASCRESLTAVLTTETARQPDVAPLFLEFYAECDRRAGEVEPSSGVMPITDAVSVIDREAETQSVNDFLDKSNVVVLEVTGLPQIGKSSVLSKALTQSGITSVLRIPLTSTSSVDYILYTLIQQGSGLPLPPYADAVSVARSASVLTALRTRRVIIFERAHLLVEGGAWRDEQVGPVMAAIIDVARETKVKLIFETQRELPIEFSDPSARQRLRVTGFQRNLRPFGVAVFDAQLRRVGLSPNILSDDSKNVIVDKLGGHPVAIALAADASYDEGGEAVIRALKDRKGFYLSFLERLLGPLNLSDEDQTILRLLTLARLPINRSAVMASTGFPAAPVLRNLVALGTVELTRDGRIEIAGILRDYFDPKELPPDLIRTFHKAAARTFQEVLQRNANDLEAAVEAEYHGGVVGMAIAIPWRLLDGALATAYEHFRFQRYQEADAILDVLLRKRRSLNVVRLAAQVAARRNQNDKALQLAHEAMKRDPTDTRILADLVKISLTQYQDDTTTKLIELARTVGAEDVSVLVAEGRMYLRQHNLYDAERVFLRAQQLTRFNAWPYYYLGITYQRMGRLDAAIDVLEAGQEFFYRSEGRNRNVLNAIRTQLGLAYLFNDDVPAAETVIDPLFEEDPSTPEVIRAYAALTIKRDGIQLAEKAFARLSEAKIRNRFDRCQFHLFYGLFQLAINNPHEASREFAKAHAADTSNVYVMMKWARTLYEIAKNHYLDHDTMYVSDCAKLVKKILEFDPDNRDGIDLLNALHQFFGVDVGDDSTEDTGQRAEAKPGDTG